MADVRSWCLHFFLSDYITVYRVHVSQSAQSKMQNVLKIEQNMDMHEIYN